MADNMSQFLSDVLRNQLAKTVQAARRVGETGAHQAIRVLAVDRHGPHDSMTSAERVLRRRLRVHGRQIGDRRESKTGAQEIDRLTHEVAYEHWHRMLFARFLAENQLLIEPVSGVSISLDECEELARERGQDRWSVSRGVSPNGCCLVSSNPDAPAFLRLGLRRRRDRLWSNSSIRCRPMYFRLRILFGWVYQFWQSEKKDEVNRSGGEDRCG